MGLNVSKLSPASEPILVPLGVQQQHHKGIVGGANRNEVWPLKEPFRTCVVFRHCPSPMLEAPK